MNQIRMNAGLAICCLAIGCASTASKRTYTLGDAQSRLADFDGHKVHYLTVGQGEHTLILVHGWAANSSFWREQVPALASRARLILVDLPGHGVSDKPRVSYTLDFFARGVVAVMRDAGISKATLIGHSMGVPVICRIHQVARERVSGLVPIDGMLRRPAFKPEEADQFIRPFHQDGYREHTTRFIHSFFKEPGAEALRDWVTSEVLRTPQHVMASAMEGMFGPGQPDWDIKKTTVPVLVLNAPNPRWTSEYEAHARALSPRSDYRVLEGTGHLLMLEKPAEFNRVLTEMLAQHRLIAK